MRFDVKLTSVIVSLLIGGFIGYIDGPALMLILWAIVGLIIGAFCVSRKAATLNGAVYGFVLAYTFMVSAYNGTAPVSTKLLPFVIFGIVGAVCGCLLALLGFTIFSSSRKRPSNSH